MVTVFLIAVLIALVSGALLIGEIAVKVLMAYVIIVFIKNIITKRKNKDESL